MIIRIAIWGRSLSTTVWKELTLFAVLFISLRGLAMASDNAIGQNAPGKNDRNFYEVLDDLLKDFEFDLKNGDVKGLKDLSLRNTGVSENIPPSFKSHLELLI